MRRLAEANEEVVQVLKPFLDCVHSVYHYSFNTNVSRAEQIRMTHIVLICDKPEVSFESSVHGNEESKSFHVWIFRRENIADFERKTKDTRNNVSWSKNLT